MSAQLPGCLSFVFQLTKPGDCFINALPFERNGETIFVMYDPPHLLKNIRNNLKRNGFIVDGNKIAWKHIERFYAIDASLPIRMAPRLTERHIALPAFSSMKVSLAAQVLSHSVAAGITTLCMISDKLDSEAIHTAKFLEQFNQLFDVFNSRTMAGPNNFSRGITAESNLKECLQ